MTVPDLSVRVQAHEMMDDVSITDNRLTAALDNLWWTNKLLGGWAATNAVLDPVLQSHDHLRVLDLGTGGADALVHLVPRAERMGCRLTAVGLDANPAVLAYGQRLVERQLPPSLQRRITLVEGDALALPYDRDAFDVTVAALFLHHFHGADCVRVLREMDRVGRLGAVVNDLHRHVLAYVGIWLLGRLLPTSAMFRNDAPLSVRRGFRRKELCNLARSAEWARADVRWHWAFRYTLSSLPART